MKKRFFLVLIFFLLVLSFFSLAQEECFSDEDCLMIYGEGYLCSEGECLPSDEASGGEIFADGAPEDETSPPPDTASSTPTPCFDNFDCPTSQICLENLCQTVAQFTQQNVVAPPPSTPPAAQPKVYTPLDQQVSGLSQKIDTLDQQNQQTAQQLTDLNTQVQGLNQNLQTLSTDVQSLKSQQSSSLNQLNTFSTGLATVQTTLQNTQTEVTDLEEKVSDVEESSSFTKKILFIIIFVLAFAGAATYILYYKKPKAHPDLKKHLYQNIQQGRPYPHVRKELLEAGWPEEHVDSAYKTVLTHNYKRYLQSKTPSAESPDKRKTTIIAVASILILVVALFIVKATVGKAIQTQATFAHEQPFVCTPPHIVTEGGCCLDNNNNGVCDLDEEYEKERVAAPTPPESCSDHRNCPAGQLCINAKCALLDSLYRTDCPGEKCNINQLQILTGDGETYTLHAKKGSYTAGGALAWTIRPVPNYCRGELIKVPFEIERTGLVCYDRQSQEISCDQNTDITCTTDQDCKACPALFGASCKCLTPSPNQGRCIKDVIKKIKTKVLSKEIITLSPGQTSQPLTHPNSHINEKLNGFTLQLKNVNEFCFG